MLCIFLGRFIKSGVIKAVYDLSSIVIGEENELADELCIGHQAWEFISAEEDYMDSNVTCFSVELRVFTEQ